MTPKASIEFSVHLYVLIDFFFETTWSKVLAFIVFNFHFC